MPWGLLIARRELFSKRMGMSSAYVSSMIPEICVVIYETVNVAWMQREERVPILWRHRFPTPLLAGRGRLMTNNGLMPSSYLLHTPVTGLPRPWEHDVKMPMMNNNDTCCDNLIADYQTLSSLLRILHQSCRLLADLLPITDNRLGVKFFQIKFEPSSWREDTARNDGKKSNHSIHHNRCCRCRC